LTSRIALPVILAAGATLPLLTYSASSTVVAVVLSSQSYHRLTVVTVILSLSCLSNKEVERGGCRRHCLQPTVFMTWLDVIVTGFIRSRIVFIQFLLLWIHLSGCFSTMTVTCQCTQSCLSVPLFFCDGRFYPLPLTQPFGALVQTVCHQNWASTQHGSCSWRHVAVCH
jgi:hypothetical protein